VAGEHEVVVGHHEGAVRARVVVHRGAAVVDRAMLLPGLRRCRGRVLRTLRDQVAAKLRIIGHRWVICPRRAIARARGPEIGQAAAMLPIGRTWAIGQALARVLSLDHDQPPAHDHQHAMCKIFLICQMSVAGMSALADRRAASVTWLRPQVAR
jgi:hypothetical protein